MKICKMCNTRLTICHCPHRIKSPPKPDPRQTTKKIQMTRKMTTKQLSHPSQQQVYIITKGSTEL